MRRMSSSCSSWPSTTMVPVGEATATVSQPPSILLHIPPSYSTLCRFLIKTSQHQLWRLQEIMFSQLISLILPHAALGTVKLLPTSTRVRKSPGPKACARRRRTPKHRAHDILKRAGCRVQGDPGPALTECRTPVLHYLLSRVGWE